MEAVILTKKDLVALALERQASKAQDFVQPYEVTQYGLAETLNLSRAHAAVELRKLEDKGLVAHDLAHVKGTNKARSKSYRLTPEGRKYAGTLLEAIGGRDNLDKALSNELQHTKPKDTLLRLREELIQLKAKATELEERIERLEQRGVN